MLTRRQSRELTPFTRSHTPYGLITPKVIRVAKRVRREIDASAHNATLTLIAEELVLATVIEYLRRESGSLLRRDTGNFIDVSAVCRDFRAINRSCAEQWLAGLQFSDKRQPVDFRDGEFANCHEKSCALCVM